MSLESTHDTSFQRQINYTATGNEKVTNYTKHAPINRKLTQKHALSNTDRET